MQIQYYQLGHFSHRKPDPTTSIKTAALSR